MKEIEEDLSKHKLIKNVNLDSNLNRIVHKQKSDLNINKKRSMQEFSCSLITGIVKVGVIQPFDFIRFRIQSQHSLEHRLHLRNFIKGFISKEGVNVFMKGLNVTTFSVFSSSIVQFTLYQRFFDLFSLRVINSKGKERTEPYSSDIFKIIEEEIGEGTIKTNTNDKRDELEKLVKKVSITCAIAGVLSGISLALLLTPVDNVRIKLQAVQNLQTSWKGEGKYKYRNSFDCIKDVYKVLGIRGFYIALPISIVREAIASLIYFGSFEYLKNREKVKYNRKRIKLINSFLYGAFAGGVNWLLTLPIDVVKTKIISDTIIPDSQRYKSSIDCARQIYSLAGMRGFYKGFSVVFTRALVVNGAVLTSFDICRSKLAK